MNIEIIVESWLTEPSCNHDIFWIEFTYNNEWFIVELSESANEIVEFKLWNKSDSVEQDYGDCKLYIDKSHCTIIDNKISMDSVKYILRRYLIERL